MADETNASYEEKKSGFSFAFAKSKKKETKLLETKVIGEEVVLPVKKQTDFILSVEENTLHSVIPQEGAKELVIPLIQRNHWKPKTNSEHRDKAKSQPTVEGGKTLSATKNQGYSEGSSADLENEAVKEIMKDVAKYNEEWDDRDNEDMNLTIPMPLLMQNKVPDGFETDDKLDVSIRPDEASEADYDQVPIEQYGLAMLRGMGWKSDLGIGSKMKKVVAPIEVTLRPKGQGLGADRRPGDELDNKKRKAKRKPGDPAQEEDKPQGFTKDACVLITSGPHRNLYGKIEGVDEDNSRIVIKLALSSQSVTLSQFAAQLVSKEEYKKYSKDLGKFSKGHEELMKRETAKSSKSNGDSDKDKSKYRDLNSKSSSRSHRHDSHRTRDDGNYEKHAQQRDKHKHSDIYVSSREGKREDGHRHGRDCDRYGDKHTRRDRHEYLDANTRDTDTHSNKYREDTKYHQRHREDADKERGRHGDRKHKESRTVDNDESEAKKRRTDHDRYSSKAEEPVKKTYWLRPDLRVRFIDTSYKQGKYYNVKVKVIDVITMDTCTCQTDEGRLIEDVHQSMVETLIPKKDPAYVMVVSGKLKGQLGIVLKKDKANCQADVQLLREREKIVALDYDSFCEYAGNIQEEEDY